MKDYFLGLDMGTDSVGWAATNSRYELLRIRGRDLWGIREFDEAETSADRRAHRVSRRRLQRMHVMTGLLKDYFADEIEKTDPGFYARLENSRYYPDDKENAACGKDGIFHDSDYTDREYYAQYPTIFHLRLALLNDTAPHGNRYARQLFLSLLNMFHHRGHFLLQGLSSNDIAAEKEETYRAFSESLSELCRIQISEKANAEDLNAVLSSRRISRSAKAEKIMGLWQLKSSDRRAKEFAKAVCGLKTDAAKLFSSEEEQIDGKAEFSFSDSDYDEKREEVLKLVGSENVELIDLMKQLYDRGTLSAILGKHRYLSEARVEAYDRHHKDLKTLKSVVKKYGKKGDYDKLFRSDENGSYSAYVNSFNSGEKRRRGMKGRKREDFYKTVKGFLTGYQSTHPEDRDISDILEKISNETFMPKQLIADNGSIPNQLHAAEMRAILKNAEGVLPFLLEKDDSGLSVSERILQLFSFRIPYYVGPVSVNSKKYGGNGWVVRKEGQERGPVLPWNIEDKIDMEKTREEFIRRLIRQCTYLSGEKVLPRASLLYERYAVLNELSNLRVRGEKIPAALKQDVYNELFLEGKRVTRKKIAGYLKNRGWIEDEGELSGVLDTMGSSLSSYGRFHAIFGDKLKEDRCRNMMEDVIKLCTIYGDDKIMMKKLLCKKYGEEGSGELTAQQIDRIAGYKFRDWGRLSREFLELQGCDKSDGELKSLIDAMWDSNLNLMELINSDDYTYKEELERKREKSLRTLSDFTAEDLKEDYFSAPVRRMVWQSILVIKDVEQTVGKAPSRVFIEMTRKPEKRPKIKDSRKKMFLDLYKNIRDSSKDWNQIINKADEDGTLRSKKMYLYLTQEGRDMYTGDSIDLDALFNDNLYDIDHIYPRHFVKDDNIANNLVLVSKQKNARKSDSYPLDSAIRNNPSVQGLWKQLYSRKLITEEKFKRLTGRNEFSDQQLEGFIARQLVETAQGTKGVADILRMLLPEATVIYSKASNVSDFRQEYGLPKSRLVNDFHHAHDAYLNIVVGNVYFTKFTQNPANFIREYRSGRQKNYNLDKMFRRDVERGEYKAWTAPAKDGSSAGTIALVKKSLEKTTPILSRMSYEGHGGLFDQNLIGKKDAKNGIYLPIKSSDSKVQDVTKYGGYNKPSTAYFFLVEYDGKKGRERSLETVPIFLRSRFNDNKNALEEYCRSELHLKNPSVRVAKIKLQSLVSVNGYRLHITGRSLDRLVLRNAMQMLLAPCWMAYTQKLEKYHDKGVLEEKIITAEKNREFYALLEAKHTQGIFQKRPNPIGEKLRKHEEDFQNLAAEGQSEVLYQILRATTVGKAEADLKQINESGHSGVITLPKKITGFESFDLISQSAAGLREKRTDLLTV